MLPIRDAARLLAPPDGLKGLAPLARVFGCEGEPLRLESARARSLGAPPRSQLALVPGPGDRRLLLATLPRGASLRESVARMANGLTREAPHLQWALAAQVRDDPSLVIAACAPDVRGARLAALTVDRTRIVDSDVEAVRLLNDASAASGTLAHARWLEVLGRDATGRRFFAVLSGVVQRLAAESVSDLRVGGEARNEVALLCVSRLLFLAFLEAKGWLDGDRDFLQRQLARHSEGSLHRRFLRPLLFGTLNTQVSRRAPAARSFGRIPFLNGGLFTPTPLERAAHLVLPDDALVALFTDVLGRWRFTAREDQATWSDAAVDPEMLGHVFESLMTTGERRRGGAFYTPHALVRRVTREALAESLERGGFTRDKVVPLLDGQGQIQADDLPAAEHALLLARVRDVQVLDPACGSGAFLVHVLETLADLRGTLGEAGSTSARRRDVLVRQLSGVDASPVAVWLCQLRLWLSVVVEDETDDPARVLPLPNLDRQVMVGDALDSDLTPPGMLAPQPRAASLRLQRLRERYARVSGPRKRTIAACLTRAERMRADALVEGALAQVAAHRREILSAARSRDLFGDRLGPPAASRTALATLKRLAHELRVRRRRLAAGGGLPFSFDVHYATAASRGGFDVVIGNPPWVRAHEIAPAVRERLRSRYTVLRNPGWRAGARAAGAPAGFASQPELASAFVERSLELLAPGGTLAMLLPAKLWRTLSGAGVRTILAQRARPRLLEDWSDAPPLFDAVVYPSLMVACAPEDEAEAAGAPLRVIVHDRGAGAGDDAAREWCCTTEELAFDPEDAGSPWLLLPPDVRTAFDRLSASGTHLSFTAGVGRPMLGVKTGYNAAFLVSRDAADTEPGKLVATAPMVGGNGGPVVQLEREMLRPAIRGEDVHPWRVDRCPSSIVWTHDGTGAPMVELPVAAREWLRQHRGRLAARSDARRARRWWTLFRTGAAASSRARVVWADIDRRPRAAFLPAGDRTVPLNSCYVSICDSEADALALTALLNGPLAAAWLAALAEPARGGYRRFLGWTTALLPIPSPWREARTLLAAVAAGAINGSVPDDDALHVATCASYDLDPRSVEPLVSWWRSHHEQ